MVQKKTSRALYNNCGLFDHYGPNTHYDSGYGTISNDHTTEVTLEGNQI